jgi:hypothetical protein
VEKPWLLNAAGKGGGDGARLGSGGGGGGEKREEREGISGHAATGVMGD